MRGVVFTLGDDWTPNHRGERNKETRCRVFSLPCALWARRSVRESCQVTAVETDKGENKQTTRFQSQHMHCQQTGQTRLPARDKPVPPIQIHRSNNDARVINGRRDSNSLIGHANRLPGYKRSRSQLPGLLPSGYKLD